MLQRTMLKCHQKLMGFQLKKHLGTLDVPNKPALPPNIYANLNEHPPKSIFIQISCAARANLWQCQAQRIAHGARSSFCSTSQVILLRHFGVEIPKATAAIIPHTFLVVFLVIPGFSRPNWPQCSTDVHICNYNSGIIITNSTNSTCSASSTSTRTTFQF